MPKTQFIYEIYHQSDIFRIASLMSQDTLFPKILYFYKERSGRRMGGDSEDIPIFLASFIKYLSDFTIEPKESYSIGDIGLVELLMTISSSMMTNHRFLPATFIRDIPEQRPGMISWKHRLLKTLIFPIEIKEHKDKLRIIELSDSKIESELTALAISSLFTAPTRRGTELRQVTAQSLAYFIYELSQFAENLKKLVTDVIIDTYTWFSDHLIKNYSLYSIEVSRRLPRIARKCWKWHEVFNQINKTHNLSEFLKKIKNINKIEGKRDFLFGRLISLYEFVKGKIENTEKYDEIITVATGQWNIAHSLLLKKLLEDDGKLKVLYTQNSAEMAMIEYDIRKNFDENFNVEYLFVSETDSYSILTVLDSLMKSRGSVLVLAQGPSMIAIPLYMRCKRRNFQCHLM